VKAGARRVKSGWRLGDTAGRGSLVLEVASVWVHWTVC